MHRCVKREKGVKLVFLLLNVMKIKNNYFFIVTRAIGAIRREGHWTTYYQLIERAQVCNDPTNTSVFLGNRWEFLIIGRRWVSLLGH